MSVVKGLINTLADPRLFFILAVTSLVVLVWKREKIAANSVGYGLLGILAVFFIFGSFDPNFRLIVTKPDNVPIVGLIFLLVFFTWYAVREAVLNDRRILAGKGPVEKEESDRVWVWPIFLFGFVILWASLIVLGTFLRGPNWNFFGPFEYWDIHKLEALTNVNLSEYIWVRGMRTGLPTNWFVREIFGIVLVLIYIFVMPVVLARTWFKRYYAKLDAPRYYVGAFLFLMMMALPIKMLLRWLINLKYIVAIPEFFFNI